MIDPSKAITIKTSPVCMPPSPAVSFDFDDGPESLCRSVSSRHTRMIASFQVHYGTTVDQSIFRPGSAADADLREHLKRRVWALVYGHLHPAFVTLIQDLYYRVPPQYLPPDFDQRIDEFRALLSYPTNQPIERPRTCPQENQPQETPATFLPTPTELTAKGTRTAPATLARMSKTSQSQWVQEAVKQSPLDESMAKPKPSQLPPAKLPKSACECPEVSKIGPALPASSSTEERPPYDKEELKAFRKQ